MLEDIKAWFKDLLNMEIPEWIISPFDVEVENANWNTFLNKEFIEVTFDLKAKELDITGWTKKNEKYPKLCETVELILFAFPTFVWWNLGLDMYIIYKANRSTLNIKHDDLWLKLTNFQPYICNIPTKLILLLKI